MRVIFNKGCLCKEFITARNALKRTVDGQVFTVHTPCCDKPHGRMVLCMSLHLRFGILWIVLKVQNIYTNTLIIFTINTHWSRLNSEESLKAQHFQFYKSFSGMDNVKRFRWRAWPALVLLTLGVGPLFSLPRGERSRRRAATCSNSFESRKCIDNRHAMNYVSDDTHRKVPIVVYGILIFKYTLYIYICIIYLYICIFSL